MSFKNIKTIPPQRSKELHKKLKKFHIYLSASKKDACSNSILEAIACGLPVIAFNDGGNPEIVKKCGELYTSRQDFFLKLKKIILNYKKYQENISRNKDYSLEKYTLFIKKMFSKKMKIKKINYFNLILINIFLAKVLFFSYLSASYNLINNYMRIYLLRFINF